LTTFDTLDFDVFSNQKWDLLGDSHGQDIVVNWPDGHTTKGLAQHIEDLKAMFVYAPDTQIAVCTVARWKDGVMVEESLFWDNQTFMKQIGLAQ